MASIFLDYNVKTKSQSEPKRRLADKISTSIHGENLAPKCEKRITAIDSCLSKRSTVVLEEYVWNEENFRPDFDHESNVEFSILK